MNTSIKIALAATVSIALIPFIALQPISGYLLQNQIQQRVQQLATTHEFAISHLQTTPSFNSTTVDIKLTGVGMRALSKESITISGTIHHKSILKLPVLYKTDLQTNYHIESNGGSVNYPATLQGNIDWHGNTHQTIQIKGSLMELASSTELDIADVNGTVYLNLFQKNQGIIMDFNPHKATVKESGTDLLTITTAPSSLFLSDNGDSHYQTSSVTFQMVNLPHSLTVDNLMINNRYRHNGQLLSASTRIKTDHWHMPFLKEMQIDETLKGVVLSSSINNISMNALTQLANIATLPDAPAAMLAQFLTELSATTPQIALDEFSLKTSIGDITMSASLAAVQPAFAKLLQQVMTNNPDKLSNMVSEDTLLQAMDTSISFTVSDNLITWGCEQFTNMSTAEADVSAAEAQLMMSMCSGLMQSGNFINLACTEMPDAIVQAQCLSAAEKVKQQWGMDRTLTLTLNKGQLLLNGVSLNALLP